ncbi:MAG: matrixin family metalloprotease [Isosphaeraceae bacterium]
MRGRNRRFDRSARKLARCRLLRPRLEGLEDRLLLYSTLGDMWTYDSRITYSFMPDGTSVGGTPSVLFQTLNAKFATSTWEQQFEQAAALWEGATNVNLALVSDGGQAVGVSGNQQDDPRFGDIRIGAIPLQSGVLAETFLPPPANGGTDAGDILFNSNANWQINSTYDIMTVAAHELGHALGLGGSTVSTAVMYGTYNGIKQALTTDDISGIQSIYGTRQFDRFNDGSQHNSTYLTATNLNSYITSTAQISLAGLDITTSNQSEWFTANVPSTTTGTMTVTVQSSNLSSLAPKLDVYNSSLALVGQVSAPNTLGATISLTVSSIQAGQQYYFKVLQAGGPGPIGGYGLLVNFGNQSQAPIQPPNTIVPQQPDHGGGVINNVVVQGIAGQVGAPGFVSVGSLQVWALSYAAGSSAVVISPPTTSTIKETGSELRLDLSDLTKSPAASVWTVPTPSMSVAAPLGTTPSVFQAVDTVLDAWTGGSRRKVGI